MASFPFADGDTIHGNPEFNRLARLPVNAQAGTTYTPTVADEAALVTLSNASAITVTLPQDSAVAIPVGGLIWFMQLAAGVATFAAGSGATVQSATALSTAGQYSYVRAVKTATNTWTLDRGAAPAAASTPTFANNTAAQLAQTAADAMVYFVIGTAGSAFSIAIGPTSTPANTIVSSITPTAGAMYSFRVPAGWYVKWNGTSTTLATQRAITC